MRFTLPFVKRILQITCTVASNLWIKRPKRTTRRWHIFGFSLGFRISESTASSFHHNYSLSIKKIWHLKRNDVNLHTHWHFLSQMENWQFYHMMGIDKTTDILKQAAERVYYLRNAPREAVYDCIAMAKDCFRTMALRKFWSVSHLILYQYIRRCYRVNTNTLSRQ